MADDQNTDTTETEEVEDTTTDAEVAETSETDAGDEAKDEWVPPTREEWEALQKAQKDAALKVARANKESADRRAKIRELERQNEDDAAKAQREALEAAQARYKPIVAKSALLEAQARTDRVGHLIRLLNMEALEFGGNDDVVGLDVEIERLKVEAPEFFIQPEPEKPATPAAPRTAPKAAVAPKTPVKSELSPAERLANTLLGRQ